jgi:hypothetical protein
MVDVRCILIIPFLSTYNLLAHNDDDDVPTSTILGSAVGGNNFM